MFKKTYILTEDLKGGKILTGDILMNLSKYVCFTQGNSIKDFKILARKKNPTAKIIQQNVYESLNQK